MLHSLRPQKGLQPDHLQRVWDMVQPWVDHPLETVTASIPESTLADALVEASNQTERAEEKTAPTKHMFRASGYACQFDPGHHRSNVVGVSFQDLRSKSPLMRPSRVECRCDLDRVPETAPDACTLHNIPVFVESAYFRDHREYPSHLVELSFQSIRQRLGCIRYTTETGWTRYHHERPHPDQDQTTHLIQHFDPQGRLHRAGGPARFKVRSTPDHTTVIDAVFAWHGQRYKSPDIFLKNHRPDLAKSDRDGVRSCIGTMPS